MTPGQRSPGRLVAGRALGDDMKRRPAAAAAPSDDELFRWFRELSPVVFPVRSRRMPMVTLRLGCLPGLPLGGARRAARPKSPPTRRRTCHHRSSGANRRSVAGRRLAPQRSLGRPVHSGQRAARTFQPDLRVPGVWLLLPAARRLVRPFGPSWPERSADHPRPPDRGPQCRLDL